MADVDARSFWDAEGRLKKPSELTAEQGAALAGFEVLIKNAKAGDGQSDEIHKIKLWDKTRALEALAKHFGLVRERLEVSGWDKLAAQLTRRAHRPSGTASLGSVACRFPASRSCSKQNSRVARLGLCSPSPQKGKARHGTRIRCSSRDSNLPNDRPGPPDCTRTALSPDLEPHNRDHSGDLLNAV
jgi:hypothetical protein